MIIDARQLAGGQSVQCDICIVGAGPAGIVLALELARRGRDVVLLESGGTKFESRTNDLNKGAVADPLVHGPLEDYRRRRLGGATTAWGGRCVPFDEIDFEPRDYVPHSGWPFDKKQIDPFYARAHAFLGLGRYSYEAADVLTAADRGREMIPGAGGDDVTMSPVYLFSPPTDFGTSYREELATRSGVRMYLYANCLNIGLNAEGTRVERIEAATQNGKRITFAAREFVLAAGGLEVVRLMLASNRVHANGIGNQHDLLGRYYMCHAIHHLEVEFARPGVVWDYEKTIDGVYCQRTISLTQQKQRELKLLNHRARIEHPPIEDASHRNGVLSAAFLAKRMLRANLVRKHLSPKLGTVSRGVVDVEALREEVAGKRAISSHARNVIYDMPAVFGFSRRWIKERILSERKLPSMVLPNKANTYTLRIDAEQAPNPASRVTLGDATDEFAQRRLAVDWRYTELDASSLRRTAELLGQALLRSGAAKTCKAPPVEPKATGGHHLGITRMAQSPSGGVVDADCRVHGVENLFIASSSVFPTSSYANPTLMVLALTLRLCDHLLAQRL